MPTLSEHAINFRHDLDILISEIESNGRAQVATIDRLGEDIDGIKTILGRDSIWLDEILALKTQHSHQQLLAPEVDASGSKLSG